MRRWLCALLCACLLATQAAPVSRVALGEAPQMGVDEMTRRFMAENLQSVDDDQSYRQIGREVSEALGRGEDGLLKPGTRLLRLLTMPQGDELIGNHFEMPSGDWDKLAFMFAQGLMQYELRGALRMAPDAPLTGSLDGSIELDAGYDSDGCLAMDGSVLSTLADSDGWLEIQGDDMYARVNRRTGEQRVKPPFMDELNLAQSNAVPEDGGQLLLSRLRQDAPHWADALDLIYENVRDQPELLPLFRHWFECGEAPAEQSMTTEQLYRALARALNDLSADQRFADALSKTALLDALYMDGALRFDPAAMSDMQRKFALMGLFTLAASELNRQDTAEWPSGALSVSGDRAALSLTFEPGRYGSFAAKLDASMERADDGVSLRVTLIDEAARVTGSRGAHTARVDCADGRSTLLYNFADDRGGSGRHLWLDVGRDGLEIEYEGDEDIDLRGSLSVRKLDDAGGYSTRGELGSLEHAYFTLDGGGEFIGGVASGELALDYLDEGDVEPTRVISASYSVGGGQVELSGRYDSGEIGATRVVFDVDLSAEKTDDAFDLRASYGYGPAMYATRAGHQLRVGGAKRKGKWTGDLWLTPMMGETPLEPIAYGEYALTPRKDGGELSADLTVVNGSAKIPVHFGATKGARSLSLLASAMQNYKLSMDLNLDPDDLLLGYGAYMGALAISEMKLSSRASGERRKSAFEIVQGGRSVQRIELDSRVRPIEDGFAFEHRLSALPALEGFASVGVDGEATAVLDMRSGSPLVLRQAGSFDIEVEGGGATGEFELNHRFHVDERKHREPREPRRIERRIEPEPAEEDASEDVPEEDEEYGDPVDPEEEYGDPVDAGRPAPRVTKRPRGGARPAPTPTPEPEPRDGSEPEDEPGDEYDDLFDAAHYTYVIDASGARVTSYFGSDAELYVPIELDGAPVGAIGEAAFADNERIQSVLVSDAVVSIGAQAFGGCTGLSWVYVPQSCTDIADDAFAGCGDALMLLGYSGSAAQAFAQARGIMFVPLDDQPDESAVPDDEPPVEPADEPVDEQPIEQPDADAPAADAPAAEPEIDWQPEPDAGYDAGDEVEDEPLAIEPEIVDA